jgi:hypothetical protein
MCLVKATVVEVLQDFFISITMLLNSWSYMYCACTTAWYQSVILKLTACVHTLRHVITG